MARDAVVCRQFISSGRRGLNVMLRLIVNDEHRIALVVVHAMRNRTERRDAQREQQHARGRV